MEKNYLFEKMPAGKALLVMALPTIASQMITMIYSIADVWFLGRTNNPYMIGASSLAATVYLFTVTIANVFGVGGGSLMVRLLGEKRPDEARKAASYSLAMSAVTALAFSVLILIFTGPLLHLLGASENTLEYGKQYLWVTAVIGGLPTVLSMSMPLLLRNAGYSKEAGFGVALGGILNVILDPLFMFVILPSGKEVLGAALATMISNVITLIYFIFMFIKVKDKTVLVIPRKLERLGREHLRSLYSVGTPAALAIFLFDIVMIVTNRLAASHGDIPLAAMGIILKIERVPMNVGLGICLGMVPLAAYNYGAKNFKRLNDIISLARTVMVVFACICVVLFRFFALPMVGAFIADEETVRYGVMFLRGRALQMPFMMLGYHVINYMNAVNRGKVSLFLAVLRHLILIIPIMLIMNAVLGINGLILSQPVADVICAAVSMFLFFKIRSAVEREV